jgi:nucleotide-binding universal stress UspA family protein
MSVPNSVLVAVDGSPATQRALDASIELALEHAAVLTILALEPPWRMMDSMAPIGLGLIPFCGFAPLAHRPPGWWAERAIRRALEQVPQSVSVRTICRVGRFRRVLTAVVDEGDFDVVLLGCSVHAWLPGRCGRLATGFAQGREALPERLALLRES